MTSSSSPNQTSHSGLSTPVLLLMSVACGLCAGGNYFNQPLLHSIATSFQVSEATAAFTVTVAQVAYAFGLLLLVPLGDKLERRSLVVLLMLLAATGQFISGFTNDIGLLFAGIVMAGLFSVAAQILVPMAATLSDPARSGRAVGIVMSGLLIGILMARSVAGLLSGLGGWHTVYRVAGVTMLVVALALWFVLPSSRNPVRASYLQILASMATLIRDMPRLRSRSIIGALAFASVSALFSTMALLLSGPAHGLDDAQIGLVGLIGVAGALMANVAGRLSDRGWDRQTSMVSAVLLLLSWGGLYLGGTSLLWFVAGMLLIDLALQGLHISNQQIVYQLMPEARSRINAVYMTTYFIGAALGSAAGSLAWNIGGWGAICVTGAILAMLTGFMLWHDGRLQHRASGSP
ncbi:MAG: MFS transporter [Oxalicibacterium faecigallinarum]|uniref:MFS transporter n=1 Tax=Oxalicibacterium faecigallinarum TaxID=573741 RepID=UPI002808D289|nr:MFS transporter [Oxalicibacterium faecigallinarum]MDQ7968238.1 MFS transporter [Oxalicibacterium faecigallinarum]